MIKTLYGKGDLYSYEKKTISHYFMFLQSVHSELLAKEGLVEEIRAKGQELIKTKKGVPGMEVVQQQLAELGKFFITNFSKFKFELPYYCLSKTILDIFDFPLWSKFFSYHSQFVSRKWWVSYLGRICLFFKST